jgi:hypothetical protein
MDRLLKVPPRLHPPSRLAQFAQAHLAQADVTDDDEDLVTMAIMKLGQLLEVLGLKELIAQCLAKLCLQCLSTTNHHIGGAGGAVVVKVVGAAPLRYYRGYCRPGRGHCGCFQGN